MTGPSIFVSAGEPSGDEHAARLGLALRAAAPGVVLAGMGGPAMAGVGIRLVHGLGALQTVGFVEVAGAVPAHVRAYAAVARELRRAHYDLLILVDYPGFHRRVAALARAIGIPVLYYIAPQLWAWGSWRARGMRRTVSRMAVILPFEEAFFRDLGIRATFVGHPLLDDPRPTREQARTTLGITPDEVVLGLFPGSRRTERARLWPAFHGAAVAVQGERDARVLVAGRADDLHDHEVLAAQFAPSAVVAAAADVAIAKSGTTSLQLALAGTPHLLAYRTHPLTYAAARRLALVPWIGLVNLILGRSVVPELLQAAASPKMMATLVRQLLDPEPAQHQRTHLRDAVRALGAPGASGRVADVALGMVA